MKLSIITINYNNKAGLQKTIDSVICQTWRDFEWIVIDGGSADGSKELIEQYPQHFAYWCSEPDKGVYNAMNKGIDHAKGEYLLFLNSGDALYDKDVLQKVQDLKLNADIISGQMVRMDNNQLLRSYDESILKQLYYNTLNHQGTFIKKLLFEELRYDETLKVVSDWKFWLDSIIWKKAKVTMIDMIVAKQDMTGISSVHADQDKMERKRVLDEYFPYLIQKDLTNYWKMTNSIYVQRGEYLCKNSDFAYKMGIRFMGILVRIIKLVKKN